MTRVMIMVMGPPGPPAQDCLGFGSGQGMAMEETSSIWREAGHSLGYMRLPQAGPLGVLNTECD